MVQQIHEERNCVREIDSSGDSSKDIRLVRLVLDLVENRSHLGKN